METLHLLTVKSLESIKLNDGIKILIRCFSNCYELKSVNLLDSINCIGDHAFEDCYSLATINIFENVKYKGSGPKN